MALDSTTRRFFDVLMAPEDAEMERRVLHETTEYMDLWGGAAMVRPSVSFSSAAVSSFASTIAGAGLVSSPLFRLNHPEEEYNWSREGVGDDPADC